jgi:hypothetical protein
MRKKQDILDEYVTTRLSISPDLTESSEDNAACVPREGHLLKTAIYLIRLLRNY